MAIAAFRGAHRVRATDASERAALQRQTRRILAERVFGVLMLGTFTTMLSMLVDLRTEVPRLAVVLLTKVATTCAYGVGAIAVWSVRESSWQRTFAVVLPAACLLGIMPGAIGLAFGDPVMCGFILSVVTLGGALVFPWGR